jgi:hypothetical protein
VFKARRVRAPDGINLEVDGAIRIEAPDLRSAIAATVAYRNGRPTLADTAFHALATIAAPVADRRAPGCSVREGRTRRGEIDRHAVDEPGRTRGPSVGSDRRSGRVRMTASVTIEPFPQRGVTRRSSVQVRVRCIGRSQSNP